MAVINPWFKSTQCHMELLFMATPENVIIIQLIPLKNLIIAEQRCIIT